MPQKPFKGIIKLDVRDSVADWTPYLPAKAPEGAPNILFVLFDDTGLAAWSPFGGGINMPTLQKLADNGLRYSQWHTTALCSPTRSTLLTGRNHHLNGMAAITEGANGFPGANGRIPLECATMAQILQDNGWSTFWLGKDHNVPEQDIASGATRKQWPLQQGFDRFYGFLGGETNQWYPDLVDDNKFIDQPYQPEEGYHLSKDLADQALRMLRDHHATNPSRPWYMWFCPGANHAPHHCPQDYIDKYKGKFDAGYEAYRDWVLPRMIEKGILPKGTELTPLNPLPADVANAADMVRPWETLNAQEKQLFSTPDGGVRRLLGIHRRAGRPNHRLPRADRTARQHGRHLRRRQRRVGRRQPERIGQREQVLQRLSRRARGEPEADRPARRSRHLRALPDRLGGGDVDAVQDVQALLGVRRRHVRSAGDLLAEGHQGPRRGAQPVSPQHRHRPDASSTSAGWRCRRSTAASSSTRCRACRCATPSSRRRRRRRRSASTTRCSARARSGRTAGRRSRFTRRSRARAISTRTCGSCITSTSILPSRRIWPRSIPRSCKALIEAWFEEADKNLVLPIDDRTALEQLNIERPSDEPPRDRYIYSPGTSPVPEGVAVNVRGRSYKILADVEITDPNCSGVIFAHGSRFGGHSLFIKDKKLYYVYNFLGIPPEQQFIGPELKPGKYTLGMEFTREKAGQYHESHRHDQTLRQRQSRGRGPDARASRQVHPVGRRPVRRPRQW